MPRPSNHHGRRQNVVGAVLTICAFASFAMLESRAALADPSYSIVHIKHSYWTILTRINDNGFAIGGYTFRSVGNPEYGLIRSPDGTITRFDPAGSTNTYPNGINDAGAVTGVYWDSAGAAHGFVRAPDGTITSFDVPGAKYTYGMDINNNDEVSGFYKDDSGIGHGFVRSVDGSFTIFDAPEGTYGTAAYRINKKGVAAGLVQTQTKFLGFIRRSTGKIVTFARVTLEGTKNTFVQGLNNQGVTVGYFQGNKFFHGFVRAATGGMTIIDVPGARGTRLYDVNNGNISVGDYVIHGGQDPLHGAFLRAPDGTIETFRIPNHKTESAEPLAVNDSGVIVGYVGPSAFVRMP